MSRKRVGQSLAGLAMLLLASVAGAQESPSPDELKRMYDDAVTQLKAAQDRRAELAAENETLKARVVELETNLAATTQQVQQLQAESAVFAEKTFFLRSHYAAFQAWLQKSPELLARWRAYLGSPPSLPRRIDPIVPGDAADDELWFVPRQTGPVG